MKIKGKLVKKMDVETGTSKSGKDWKKQLVLIDTGADYNPEICLQIFGSEKVESIEKLKIGKEYDFSINIISREYKGKYYTNIDCWKVENVETESVAVAEDSDNMPF